MIGDWAMVRGNGQPICGLTLTNTEATADNFAGISQAEMRSGGRGLCADAVAAGARRMLLMSDSGEVWRFEADDNAQWRRVPDSADPLIMLRQ